ncbi:hypothetical protein Q8A73_004336 [Channa argus]|nr:hypothetical protein Q8A73_004336 [Channa argus]
MVNVPMSSLATAARTTSGPTSSSTSWNPAALQVSCHKRDFIPGCTMLEKMSDCIQDSQCLLRLPGEEAYHRSAAGVPLHFCVFHYLEGSDPDFKNKLHKVLCNPNRQLQGSTVITFQPPSMYNGKALPALTAVNDESLNKWD